MNFVTLNFPLLLTSLVSVQGIVSINLAEENMQTLWRNCETARLRKWVMDNGETQLRSLHSGTRARSYSGSFNRSLVKLCPLNELGFQLYFYFIFVSHVLNSTFPTPVVTTFGTDN